MVLAIVQNLFADNVRLLKTEASKTAYQGVGDSRDGRYRRHGFGVLFRKRWLFRRLLMVCPTA